MAYVINDDCTACGTCIDECPTEAISEGDIYVIDADLCTDCGSCADVCPVEAISPEQHSINLLKKALSFLDWAFFMR